MTTPASQVALDLLKRFPDKRMREVEMRKITDKTRYENVKRCSELLIGRKAYCIAFGKRFWV